MSKEQRKAQNMKTKCENYIHKYKDTNVNFGWLP